MKILGRYVRGEIALDDIMQSAEMRGVIETIESRTLRWAYKMGYVGKVKIIPDDVRDWMNFFAEREFGRSASLKKDMMELVEKLTQVPISKYSVSDGDRVIFERGVVVVPLGNDNSHNYHIGSPVCNFRDGDSFMKMNGDLGDRLTRTRNLLRPATSAEILMYLRNLISNNTDSALALFSSI